VKTLDIFCPFCDRLVWSVSKLIVFSAGVAAALIAGFLFVVLK
jgi:hypothetical protein